jgi:carbamoyl-phosphate synthase small subunit
MKIKTGILTLANNQKYIGEGFGAENCLYGELVFNTSMTGYIKSLTDPSYAGQILAFNYPLIGNYGVSSVWGESEKLHTNGVVVGEHSEFFEHNLGQETLDSFLKRYNKPGISGIDTRNLVKNIREFGTIPSVLTVANFTSQELDEYINLPYQQILTKVNNPEDVGFLDWARRVSVTETRFLTWREDQLMQTSLEELNTKPKIVVVDCGVKSNICREVVKRGYAVVLVPPDCTAKDILKYNPKGIILSNGPGDPRDYDYLVQTTKNLLTTDIPIFGICLGNQILALAIGAKVYKMKFGNRGGNQPVIDLFTQKAYSTSQNHSYAIDPKSLSSDWKVWFKNLNDNTVEGLCHLNKKIFSVQFHPEAKPGPQDTSYLFDKFLEN